MNIADRIQDLRKQKGYSQEELADKVGVSRQAVSKWESAQSMPDLEKIIATITGKRCLELGRGYQASFLVCILVFKNCIHRF